MPKEKNWLRLRQQNLSHNIISKGNSLDCLFLIGLLPTKKQQGADCSDLAEFVESFRAMNHATRYLKQVGQRLFLTLND
ncbi:hypothetical protein [Agrobacterium larrymoorei]|uniref:Uncharacterized protein n=1 Tax=Agrobacterium larrymoorei TaxID=160699 RepID=A0AAF0HDX1_9HYPH|nr:hypothetical protein [Agrobacterium larrymoorei]WHA42576.1 hypothetical protein CFBP5477_013510 [Agrobacterium larrymoorei]